jgi:hypothetical protein
LTNGTAGHLRHESVIGYVVEKLDAMRAKLVTLVRIRRLGKLHQEQAAGGRLAGSGDGGGSSTAGLGFRIKDFVA